ncbi:hypothetical protein [Methylobacterium sp. E-045]|uniref:hypothetical protein n=1 Tax=Methylobacterium sp. E-045 TaxID=2836575 RepID=UPI001FB97E95|nr:hypothetical protein [Methylobacterium sp. E-045]MCJ2128469.1 hypothetical protein [Methylobacterium sp. E-045]
MTAGIEDGGAGRTDQGAPSPAEPEPSVRSGRALVLPLSLAMGWGALLGYSTVLLTDDPPARPEIGTIQAAFNEPGPFEDRAGGSRSPRGSAPWSDVGIGAGPSGRDATVAPPVQPGVRPVALRQDPEVAPRADALTAASPPVEPAAYVGLWGPNESACRRGARRRGYIPARITESGARAGNTVCTFRDGRRIGANWSVSASCSDGGRRWSSQVKLLVDGNRLTWSSAKGDASYIRCHGRAG